MASRLALVALFSLALFSGIMEARKDPGEYWQGVAVAGNEALVEAIEHLANVDLSIPNTKKSASDCHTSKKDSVAAISNKKSFVTDFEPRPSATAYGEVTKQKEDKSFMKDFEPRPNVSVYDNGTGLKGEKKFDKDFEPRPNVSVYDNGTGLKGEKKFDKDFEPRPNVSVYED